MVVALEHAAAHGRWDARSPSSACNRRARRAAGRQRSSWFIQRSHVGIVGCLGVVTDGRIATSRVDPGGLDLDGVGAGALSASPAPFANRERKLIREQSS